MEWGIKEIRGSTGIRGFRGIWGSREAEFGE